MQDEYYMARALKLAQRGRFTTHPNPNVGCVIVKDGEIVGEGYHQRAGEPHAEVHALRMAGEKAKGATAYVTLEPCSHHGRTPPCCDALIAAGVARVVASMQDPNPQVAGRGLYRLQQAGIDVSHGLMMSEAEQLNKGFLKRMRTGFPYIQLKLGASLDGHRIVQQPGETWFARTQEDSREWPETVRTLLIPEHKGHLDLVVLMMQLGKQQINSIWVEAGPTLAGALLQAGLVDELIVYIAPKLLGSDARGLCTLPGLEKLADAPQFKFKEIRHVGPDVCLHLVGA